MSLTVLLVDDDPVVRKFVANVLGTQRYIVLQAESAAAASHVVEATTSSIDILIADHLLIDAYGHEVVRYVRAAYPDLKVVYMSGYPRDMVDPVPANALYLQKPFSPVELRDALSTLQTQ